jgi:hypothetical protein
MSAARFSETSLIKFSKLVWTLMPYLFPTRTRMTPEMTLTDSMKQGKTITVALVMVVNHLTEVAATLVTKSARPI